MNPELEAAQVARIAMEKTERLEWIVKNISAHVKHGKALPVGQYSRDAAGRQRRGENVKIGSDFYDVACSTFTVGDALGASDTRGFEASALHEPGSDVLPEVFPPEVLPIERTIPAAG